MFITDFFFYLKQKINLLQITSLARPPRVTRVANFVFDANWRKKIAKEIVKNIRTRIKVCFQMPYSDNDTTIHAKVLDCVIHNWLCIQWNTDGMCYYITFMYILPNRFFEGKLFLLNAGIILKIDIKKEKLYQTTKIVYQKTNDLIFSKRHPTSNIVNVSSSLYILSSRRYISHRATNQPDWVAHLYKCPPYLLKAFKFVIIILYIENDTFWGSKCCFIFRTLLSRISY